jgi:TonB family protein
MKIWARDIRNTVLVVICLLLVYAIGEANQQDKSKDGDDFDKVYSRKEVDEKAILRPRLFNDSVPEGVGCPKNRGRIRLRAVLRKSGKVTDVEALEKSGCESFDKQAIKDVKTRKFTPAKKGGVAVSQYLLFEYTYNETLTTVPMH